jgi:hypothetical protein
VIGDWISAAWAWLRNLNPQWVEAIGTWFAAFATVGAVILALRLRRAEDRRSRPRLEVSFAPESDDHVVYVPPQFASAEPRHEGAPRREELWIRITVQNLGDTAAKDVEVRLQGVVRRKDSKKEGRANLWFKVSNVSDTMVRQLPRGFPAHFDVAFVKHTVDPADVIGVHLVIVKPDMGDWEDEKARIEKEERNALEIGWNYDINLVVLGSNADAVHYQVSMRCNPRRDKDPGPGQLLGPNTLTQMVEASGKLTELPTAVTTRRKYSLRRKDG